MRQALAEAAAQIDLIGASVGDLSVEDLAGSLVDSHAAKEGLDEAAREQLKRETLANIERVRADPEAAAAELASTCSAGKQGFNLHDLIFPRAYADGGVVSGPVLICAAAGAALLALAVKAYLDSTFKNQANSGQGGSLPNQQAGGNTTPAMPDPEDGDDPSSKLTSSQEKAIRSYEKRIAEHEAKLAEFKANPTVRPGMEHLPRSVIEQQQAARIRHLEVEIRTFKNNIDKIRGSVK